MNFQREVLQNLGIIGKISGETVKQVQIVSWSHKPRLQKIGLPKYDIREWRMSEKGSFLQTGNGITLSESEARSLCALLMKHFRKEGGTENASD